MAGDAVISLDCGANTLVAARNIRLRENQRLDRHRNAGDYGARPALRDGTQLAYPGRQSVAVVGDGGFAMLMAELATAVAQNLPVEIILRKNNSLAEVKFEQKEIANTEHGCDLPPIDFVAFAKACGADAFLCERPDGVRSAISAALNSSKAPLV
jgi:pyruvate dehydrogenase (quinone)